MDKRELLIALREADFGQSSIDSLTSLDELLSQISSEFEAYVVVQARGIAQMNGEVNKDKAKILQIINAYFARHVVLPKS